MNATSATDTGLPGSSHQKPSQLLTEYLRKMQSNAMRVEKLLGAVSACIDDAERQNICVLMIEEGWTIARDLNQGLDSVNLPEGALS